MFQRTNTPVGIIRIVTYATVHYQRTKILIKSIVSNKDEWRLCVNIKFICMKQNPEGIIYTLA